MEPPSKTISVVNESGRRLRTDGIRRAVEAALRLGGQKDAQVVVLLTTDEAICDLNARFRSMGEPTDVLTFPAGEFLGAPLGDVAISVPYAQRQAAARRVSLTQELGYLAIHGTLHLLGFDDETEPDRARMVAEMNRAAVEAGLRPDLEWASILHGEQS